MTSFEKEIATAPTAEPRPEDLRCPECGYGVFGASQSRCPECGEPFKWAEVRAAALAPTPLVFEFFWRQRPMYSFVRTWSMSVFRPWRLWREYENRRSPVAVRPLLLLMLLQMLLFVQSWPLVGAVMDWGMNQLAFRLTAGQLQFTYNERYTTAGLLAMGLWYLATFAALQLFFQTKRRRGVHWTRFLRVQVHALMAAAILPGVWCVAEAGLDSLLFFREARQFFNSDWYLFLQWAMFGLGMFLTFFYLGLGLRRHLQFPHAYLVSGSALLLGYLLADLATFWW